MNLTLKSNNGASRSALALISCYSSDEDSSDAIEDTAPKLKDRLPLPSALLTLNTQESDHTDDSRLHDGRARSFVHQRGNWATFVYIPYEPSDEFQGFCDKMISMCDPVVELKVISEPHISLSRTVVLLHHWIDGFVQALNEGLRHMFSYHLQLGKLSVYTNEEKSRTFLGLDVTIGTDELVNSVKVVDDCLTDFKLPTFYKDPSFHLSFAWCLGDKKKILTETVPKLQVYFEQFVQSHPELFTVSVTKYLCKSGNKFFDFKLKS